MLKRSFIWSWFLLNGLTLFSLYGQSQERVYYSSFRPEGWDIYLSKDGGKSFHPVTDDPALDYDPVISPDGKWCAFVSTHRGNADIYKLPFVWVKGY